MKNGQRKISGYTVNSLELVQDGMHSTSFTQHH
jgi:hypothetical protein